MSIPVLIEVYDEMRRLAIAGSAVVAGDFRLKKLIPPLEKSAEKAPVFGKVAQAAQAVVDSNEKTASTALLELTTLVNAILYTQGETGLAGEFKPLQTSDLGGQATQVSARILKPLLEALSSTGSGRMELVKDAFERGTFRDLRLVKPALAAIDDPYPEIGDFICEKVLPLYGKAILPELRARLDIKGRGGHLYRLKTIHHLDPEGSRDLIQSALNEGSKEMKVAAIECLGHSDNDLTYLMEQVRAKAKDVRAAALGALSAMKVKSADVIGTLKKAIAGADLELIIGRVKKTELPEIQAYLLEQAEQQIAELKKTKDKKEQGPAVERLMQLLLCLEHRTDAGAESFLLKCFDHAKAFASIKSEPSGMDLNELVAYILSQGTEKMQRAVADQEKALSDGMLAYAFLAARATLTPIAFYEKYSPTMAGIGQKGTKKKNAEILVNILTTEHGHYIHSGWFARARGEMARKEAELPELDPRWLDAAVAAGSVELVHQWARTNHPATNKFLSDQLVKIKRPHEAHHILRTMVDIAHPGAADALIDVLKKAAKESHFSYYNYWYGKMIADLPRSAFPKFEELLPTLPEKMVDQLIESVLALKSKPE